MALPKRRGSHAKVRTRRQQWKATVPAHKTCEHCGATIRPHRFCPKCHRYGTLSLGSEKEKSADKQRGKK